MISSVLSIVVIRCLEATIGYFIGMIPKPSKTKRKLFTLVCHIIMTMCRIVTVPDVYGLGGQGEHLHGGVSRVGW